MKKLKSVKQNNMTPKFKIGDIVIYKRKPTNYDISSVLSIIIEDGEIVYYLSNNILVPERYLELYNEDKKEVFIVNGAPFTMVYVEGGTFTMGTTSEQDVNAYDDERPTHEVTLSDYYIGETVVTQALWKAVMGSNLSNFISDNIPVVSVSYHSVKEFITKLNQQTGKTFHLPTEAEWEFAARGGKKSKGYKYSGSDNIDDVAWYEGNSNDKIHPVKTKQPNELGIYDMSGNVWEWCSDWKGGYTRDAQTNPQGPSFGLFRIQRGGSYSNIASHCRTTFRFCDTMSFIDVNLGFRIAIDNNK